MSPRIALWPLRNIGKRGVRHTVGLLCAVGASMLVLGAIADISTAPVADGDPVMANDAVHTLAVMEQDVIDLLTPVSTMMIDSLADPASDVAELPTIMVATGGSVAPVKIRWAAGVGLVLLGAALLIRRRRLTHSIRSDS